MVKPVSNAAAQAMARTHEFFVAWMESSRQLRAAIRQNAGDIAERTEHYRGCFNAYLKAVGYASGQSETLTPGRAPETGWAVTPGYHFPPEGTILEMARRHVIEGEAAVANQRHMVSKLTRDGHDTRIANELLTTLEATLVQMHLDLQRVERSARR